MAFESKTNAKTTVKHPIVIIHWTISLDWFGVLLSLACGSSSITPRISFAFWANREASISQAASRKDVRAASNDVMQRNRKSGLFFSSLSWFNTIFPFELLFERLEAILRGFNSRFNAWLVVQTELKIYVRAHNLSKNLYQFIKVLSFIAWSPQVSKANDWRKNSL